MKKGRRKEGEKESEKAFRNILIANMYNSLVSRAAIYSVSTAIMSAFMQESCFYSSAEKKIIMLHSY